MIVIAPATAVQALSLPSSAATMTTHCSDMENADDTSHDEQRQACLAYCLTVQAGVLFQLHFQSLSAISATGLEGFAPNSTLHGHVMGIDPPPPRLS